MSIVAACAVPHPPLIVPGVAPDKREQIAATVTAYEEVGRRIAELAPETIVLSSPHAETYLDYIYVAGGAGARGSFAQFDAPEACYEATYDQEFVRELCREAERAGIPAGTDGERAPELDHGTMVPLHFVQRVWLDLNPNMPPPRLVRMGISGLSPLEHYRMGQAVQRVAESLNRRVVYVASGDLSHKLLEEGPYGFAPEGPKFDEAVCNAFRTGDFLRLLTMDPGLCERAGECGLRSFQIMAGALDRTPVDSELLSYEGPFGVGYGVAAFTVIGAAGSAPERNFAEHYERFHADELSKRRRHEDPWVELARHTLEGWVSNAVQPVATRLLSSMEEAGRLPADARRALEETRAGCFVSIKKDGQLRGCIGTTGPTRPSLAEEICANAVSAGTRDPRFHAVTLDELPELVYDVDVLSTPEPVSSIDELDCRRYGVIVSTLDGRRGLLLPDLDGVDTVQEQLRIAASKGNIDLHADRVRLERFMVTRHL